MSELRILWVNPSGSLSVTIPVEPAKDNESEHEFLERIASKAKPSVDGKYVGATLANDLPARKFRDAWRITPEGTVALDTEKTKELILTNVRRDRDRLLRDTDSLAIRAAESGEKRQDSAKYRQALRDWPAVVSAQLDLLDNDELPTFKPIFPVFASDDNTTQDKSKKVVKS